jgi:hypothetical protein
MVGGRKLVLASSPRLSCPFHFGFEMVWLDPKIGF